MAYPPYFMDMPPSFSRPSLLVRVVSGYLWEAIMYPQMQDHILHPGGGGCPAWVEDFMAPLSQQQKELSSLAWACGNFLLFRGQRDRRMPHDGLLTVEGAQDSSIYQRTNLPILSPLYEPLSQ